MPPTRRLRWPVYRRFPSAEIEIRRIEDHDLESLNRLLEIWSSREYAKRLAAQRRGEMVQVVAWDGGVPVGRGLPGDRLSAWDLQRSSFAARGSTI